MAFAASASAAGDHAAAEDATDFALAAYGDGVASEQCGLQAAAGVLWADPATAGIMEAAALEAEAAGLSPMEVLMAQQTALLQEAQAAGSSRSWAAAAATAAAARPSSPPTQQRVQVQSTPPRSPAAATAARANPRDTFPALPSSVHSPASAQQGKSPHSVPRGWKGGRNAPKAQGVRVLNSGASSSSSSSSGMRPSQQDLHYGLMLDGLKLKDECPFEAAGAAGGAQLFGADAATAAATRQLLAEQAAAAGSRPRAAGADSCSQEAVRRMMDRAGGSKEDAQGDSQGFNSLLFATGNKVVGREWSQFFSYAKTTRWVPVTGRDGGGGTHYKLRRTLPYSGTVQTCMVASSSSDSTRGIKNAAAALRRYDREYNAELALLEAAAAQAEGNAAIDGSSGSKAAGGRR
ncbi:hypothetical protein OEZ85_005326 [Tetradesmus obliquus]|uniref:Uncharacterized protein n=1 Tax=Tetradesmus obliquus TaxID=3088 RepID=A0ABY8UIW2_TETOB|nr:hypothetical protein OEZ85_005326 [Tetradesmus obliquus]